MLLNIFFALELTKEWEVATGRMRLIAISTGSRASTSSSPSPPLHLANLYILPSGYTTIVTRTWNPIRVLPSLTYNLSSIEFLRRTLSHSTAQTTFFTIRSIQTSTVRERLRQEAIYDQACIGEYSSSHWAYCETARC
jgi:hypothetical protein